MSMGRKTDYETVICSFVSVNSLLTSPPNQLQYTWIASEPQRSKFTKDSERKGKIVATTKYCMDWLVAHSTEQNIQNTVRRVCWSTLVQRAVLMTMHGTLSIGTQLDGILYSPLNKPLAARSTQLMDHVRLGNNRLFVCMWKQVWQISAQPRPGQAMAASHSYDTARHCRSVRQTQDACPRINTSLNDAQFDRRW